MKKIIAILLFIFFVGGCKPHVQPIQTSEAIQIDGRQGREYRDDLSGMIRRSDRIVVTEHSYQYDAYDMDAGKSLIPDEIVYGARELNQQQKEFFLSTVDRLDPKTQDAFPACIFEPHHTVQFYLDGKLSSTMEICFQCGQVEWDATKASPPWSLYSGLATFIDGIGFKAERDWHTLAKSHLQ